MSTCQNFTKLCQNKATNTVEVEYSELGKLEICTNCYDGTGCVICENESNDSGKRDLCFACCRLYYDTTCIKCDIRERIEGRVECNDCSISTSALTRIPVYIGIKDLTRYEKWYNKKKLAAKLEMLAALLK